MTVCDVDPANAKQAQNKTSAEKSVKDFRRVLDDPKIDAVVIATPDHWHAPAAILACEAAKHVYVEKSQSHNLRESRLLVNPARRNNVVVQHGTQSRLNPLIMGAIEKLRSGIFGNDGTHEIDYSRWGLGVEGLPTRVVGFGGKYVIDDDAIPRPYFTDVYTIDGTRVTRNHPPVEVTDIWRNKGRVVHEKFIAEPNATNNAGNLAVLNRYETAEGKTICHQQCEFRFVIKDSQVWLLWESTFTSQTDFYFGDQEEMGLGVRLATEIAVKSKQGGRILDSEGRRNQLEIWSKLATWCAYGGPVGEQKESQVTVKAGHSLRLRFGLLMHTSQADKLSDAAKAYRGLLTALSGNENEVE